MPPADNLFDSGQNARCITTLCLKAVARFDRTRGSGSSLAANIPGFSAARNAPKYHFDVVTLRASETGINASLMRSEQSLLSDCLGGLASASCFRVLVPKALQLYCRRLDRLPVPGGLRYHQNGTIKTVPFLSGQPTNASAAQRGILVGPINGYGYRIHTAEHRFTMVDVLTLTALLIAMAAAAAGANNGQGSNHGPCILEFGSECSTADRCCWPANPAQKCPPDGSDLCCSTGGQE